MILPSAPVLRTLLARYANARIAHEEQPSPASARELADVSYTLCVLTHTGSITAALAAADSLLPPPAAAPGNQAHAAAAPKAEAATG